VGLGASAVLIGQTLATPKEPVRIAPPAIEDVAPAPLPRSRSADPILSRNPFDSKTGPLKRTPQT
jgi:hypothetical protein